MASPTVASIAASGEDIAGTTHTITYPPVVAADDVLASIIAGDSDASSFSSWGDSNTEFFDANNAGAISLAGAYKKAAGTEDGLTFTVTSIGSDETTHKSFAVAGAEDPATQAPETSTVATGTGTDIDATTVTPTGGSKDYLFMFIASWDQSNRNMDIFPTGYSTTGFYQYIGAGGCSHGWGFKAATATSEDPGIAEISGIEQWVTFAVAFHPAGAGGGSIVPILSHDYSRFTGGLT